ncbi:MAG: helix-turn-helix transcriptional regulator [Chloroflexi bacterium]|nr:helix-turn-helix transcriptional regulator [Chloroflexota bacterium]
MNILFGDWLKEKLKAKGMSQAELAKRIKVTPSFVSHLISGDRGTTIDILIPIADALKIPPEEAFRAAVGINKKSASKSNAVEEIEYLASELPEADQQDLLEYARLRQRIAEERGKYESNKGTARDNS